MPYGAGKAATSAAAAAKDHPLPPLFFLGSLLFAGRFVRLAFFFIICWTLLVQPTFVAAAPIAMRPHAFLSPVLPWRNPRCT